MFAARTVHGDTLRLKANETRSWSTAYRGPLLICAACKWTRLMREWTEFELGEVLSGWVDPFAGLIASESVRLEAVALRELHQDVPRRWSLPLGAALGVVDLVDVEPTRAMHGQVPEWEWAMGNYEPGRFAWITANPRPLSRPIACTGRQGLFNPSPELLAAIARQGHQWQDIASL